MSNLPLLKLENISKSFGGFKALKEVNLEVHNREVIGLIGDNGAGKTTLLNIIMGILQPDAGKIYFEGREVRISSPQEARNLGIEMVHQNLGDLITNFSIVNNFFLGKELCRKVGFLSILDRRTMNEIVMKRINDVGIKLRTPNQDLAVLSGGEKQAVAIARCMHFGSKLLLLDEPTSALSVKETDKVLRVVEQARDQNGLSVIFVSHLLTHVYTVSDRIVVLAKGEKIADLKKEETSVAEMTRMIS
ncbi:MAG: ATP-binding cassette domain-containing protein [Nitrososphaerales archaeon]